MICNDKHFLTVIFHNLISRFFVKKAFIRTVSHHVLLCDVTLHVAVWVFVLKELREGGVLGVSIQNHDALVVASKFGQSQAVRLPGRNLFLVHINIIIMTVITWGICSFTTFILFEMTWIRPCLLVCSWVHLTCGCCGGWREGCPHVDEQDRGACCSWPCGPAALWSHSQPCLWAAVCRAIPSYPQPLRHTETYWLTLILMKSVIPAVNSRGRLS